MNQRLGNMELLRVVSMAMVLAVHIDGASLGLPAPGSAMTAPNLWKLAVESAAIIGVNCFTMISGYFGIRLRVRSAASFLFQCLFYSVGIYLAVTAIHAAGGRGPAWSLKAFGESWLVLSHTDLWYVPAYFMLMLLAPLLNGGCAALDRRRLTLLAAALTAFNLWCGWWWGGKFNPTGYTPLQLVNVYIIGRAVAARIPAGERPSRRIALAAAGLWAVATAAVFAMSLGMESTKAFAYNSPAVMAAALGCFVVFLRLRVDSASVCMLGSAAFAVYLIHKNPYVWINYMRPTVVDLWNALPLPAFTLAAAMLAAAIYTASALVDIPRRFLWQLLSKHF